MGSELKFYLPIAKIDKEKRMVWGYASTPRLDLQGERVSLDAMKHALPDYMEWANIREMHMPSAVGVAKEATIDDKGLFIGAKISDNDAWQKCLDEVYKGFSIGGERIRKEGDTITQMRLLEISLVDRPANPDCRIEVAKAAGVNNKAEAMNDTISRSEVGGLFGALAKFFKGGDGFSAPAGPVVDAQGGNAGHHMNPANQHGGDVSTDKVGPANATPEVDKREFSEGQREHDAGTGAALPDGSFPIENEHDLRNAVHAYGRAKDKAKAKAHIISRARSLGRTDLLPEDWGEHKEKTSLASSLAKDCSSFTPTSNLHHMARIYDDLVNLKHNLHFESNMENGDKRDAKHARKIHALSQALGSLLAEHAGEQVQEENEREAARSKFIAAGITKESMTMANIFESGTAEIAKRTAAAHKMSLGKAARHMAEARKCYAKAAGCFGKAEECAEGMENEEKRKAAAASGNLEKFLKGVTSELLAHLRKGAEAMEEADEHHELAEHHVHKVASSWVGEHAESPMAGGEGYRPDASEVRGHAQREMTEGQVPEYDPERPYPGKAATARLNALEKSITELTASVDAKIEAAYQKGRADTMAQLPIGERRGRLFTVDTGLPVVKAAGGESQQTDADILYAGVDTKVLEMAKTVSQTAPTSMTDDLRDAASHASARVLGNMITATLTGKRSYGRSLLDPSFRGAAGGGKS
ncbi:MAG: HK97 family phage prohead protease [Patescibacteria group bacterium]|nr:HK97 family phage prohead protease [Patescibacteria group bacterium]